MELKTFTEWLGLVVPSESHGEVREDFPVFDNEKWEYEDNGLYRLIYSLDQVSQEDEKSRQFSNKLKSDIIDLIGIENFMKLKNK